MGREKELETIDVLLGDARDRGGALLVRGEPGIGKSALLGVAAERARAAGMRVLETSGIESETDLPFAAIHQLLQPILGGVDELPGPQRRALSAAFGMSDDEAPGLFFVALATLNLVADRAADAPVLLVVDDAQWMDGSSADVLAFIARRLGSDPICLIVASRIDAEDDALTSALLASGAGFAVLEPLGAITAAELLDAQPVELDSASRSRLLAEAQGNPLALVELPIALQADPMSVTSSLHGSVPMTARLERSFLSRIAVLPPITRLVLLVAASDDEGQLTEVLAAASEIATNPAGTEAIAPALAARLVTVSDGRVRFAHPLVRSATLSNAGWREREMVHAALAHTQADQPDRAAWHRAASLLGPDEAVAADLESAARRAQRRGALKSAVAALRRAADVTPEVEQRRGRLLLAADLAFELGRREVVSSLLDVVETLGPDQVEQTRMTLIRATGDDGIAASPEAILAMTDLADRSRLEGDTELALKFVAAAANRVWWGGHSGEIAARVVAVVDRIEAGETEPRRLVALAWAEPGRWAGHVAQILGRLPPSSVPDPAATLVYGFAATAVGHQELAADYFGRSVSTFRAEGRLALLSQALIMRAWGAIHLGSLATALADADEGGRLAQETSQRYWAARAQAADVALAGLRGKSPTTEQLSRQADGVVGLANLRAVAADVQFAHGLTALTAGHFEDAYAALARMFDPRDDSHHPTKKLWAVADLAEAATHTGHVDDVRRLLTEIGPTGDVPPRIQMAMSLAGALLADDASAESHFEVALTEDLWHWPLPRARLELEYGSWLRRRRRIAESRVHLRTARDVFDSVGAVPWGDRARSQLRATGEKSSQRRPKVVDQLTPQEIQIARLAAEGHSNREIGARLFLSPRTIGSHLYRIFPKLGVTSRAQLHVALGSDPDLQGRSVI